MLTKFRIFLLLFFPLVVLFLVLQFSVHPFLQGHATQKLLTYSSGLPSKVVLVVIDALRYNYRSRFGVINSTMEKFPQSTFFAKSRVGSPTMTTQRVESLMTGSQIFSIVNILRTFEAKKVETDNIIWQLNNHSKISAAFGDNTWSTLFNFSYSAVCTNSFDIHDLDSCDQQVYRSLPQEVVTTDKSKVTADFIVAHLLGIDHVGHSTSSINHPKMEKKINEISVFLEHLFNDAQNGTFFLVTGDHAMRQDGNHGGSSQEQTQTFVFAYFKGGQLSQPNQDSALSQIQLTSTLSILLDIPLPLNLIGNPLLGLLPRSLSQDRSIREININLCKHYIRMLQFYGHQASAEYLQKLRNAVLLSQQRQILEQLTQKLSFLKFSSPNRGHIITISVLVSILVLFFIIFAFSQELLRLVFHPSLKIFVDVLFSGISLFTLLSSFLSWDLTKNLSDSLLFGLLLAVMTGFFFNKRGDFSWIKIGMVISCIFVLAQTEADKSNEYSTSILRVTLLHQLFKHSYFLLLMSTAFFILSLQAIMKSNKKHTKNLSLKNFPFYWKISILFMTYLHFLLSHIFNQPIYFLATLLTVSIFLYLITSSFYQLEDSDVKAQTVTLLSACFLSLFMNEYYPLVLLTCWIINDITYDYSNWCIIMGLWAKCVWWWPMSNRYEYSGVNILRTYVYSQSYSTLLNGISLVLYLNSPFILNLLLINLKIFEQKKSLFKRQAIKKQKQTQDQERQSILQKKELNNHQKTLQCVNVSIFLKSNYKYVSVLLIGQVAALWATVQNNQKLIFTIMCAPLLVLLTFITFSTLLFVLILTEGLTNSFQTNKKRTTKVPS